MHAFLWTWFALCVLGVFTRGAVGPIIATGIMLMISPFWFALWVIDAGYDQCEKDYHYSGGC